MAEVYQDFHIDLDVKYSSSNREIVIKEDDTGIRFHINVADDGEPVDLTGCRIVALFAGGKGLASQDSSMDDSGITINDEITGRIDLDLFPESFSPGYNECDIQVYSREDRTLLITIPTFNFNVNRSHANEDTIVSRPEFPLLVNLVRQTEEALATANEAIDEANDASDRADTAAGNANAAAASANAAASAANSAASEANTAASEANTSAAKADIAVVAANRATESANTAATRANDAADRIESSGGVGDMTKAVYDTDGDGIVNEAAVARNARLFDDLPVANFAMVSDLNKRSPKFVTTTVTLPVSGWSGNAQRVSCSIAKADNIVFVSPAAASFDDYGEAGVRCTVQSAGYLTFACKETPAASIVVNVVAEGSV